MPIIKTEITNQRRFLHLLFGAASQRFALPACGRAWTLFGSRKNSKREKCLKMPQNPTRQVHALLARTGASNLRRLKTKTQTFSDLILHVPQFFTSPTLLKLKLRNYQNAKAEDLPKPWLKTDFAKNLLCQKK